MTTKLPPPYPERGGLVLPEELHLPVDFPSRVQPDPDAPDDYEPLPDGLKQEIHYGEIYSVVQAFFWGCPGVLVAGHSPVYYLDEDGRQQIFYPDCYVAFGVDPVAIRRRNGYFIERVGRPPEFVLEIASISTFRNDLGPKRDLYARLGIEEYWRFDSTTDFYPAPLAGERLEGQEYQPIEINRDAQGVFRGRSPTLGLVLCWDRGDLRFYDPAIGGYRPNLRESEFQIAINRAARQKAEARVAVDVAARQKAEARIAVDIAGRQKAEAALAALRTARAAERQDVEAALAADRARIQQLEEELRRWQSEG